MRGVPCAKRLRTTALQRHPSASSSVPAPAYSGNICCPSASPESESAVLVEDRSCRQIANEACNIVSAGFSAELVRPCEVVSQLLYTDSGLEMSVHRAAGHVSAWHCLVPVRHTCSILSNCPVPIKRTIHRKWALEGTSGDHLIWPPAQSRTSPS